MWRTTASQQYRHYCEDCSRADLIVPVCGPNTATGPACARWHCTNALPEKFVKMAGKKKPN